MRFVLASFLALLVPSAALAGSCDAIAKKASSTKGPELIGAFQELVSCDKVEAEAHYDAFMKASGDVGTLVDLSLVAIDAKVYTPVWNMMEKIPDYSARDEIAKGVGARCDDHAEVLTFLQGAYFGLRSVQFGQWDDALVTCETDALTKWLESLVADPPASSYDEKYATVVTAYIKRLGKGTLPVLQKAAIDAAKDGGPFSMIIEKMQSAVEPTEIGERMAPEDKKALEKALVEVANTVGPEQAALVADRLYNAGADAAAAGLLPRVYPDRVQADGKLLYGVAAIEVCEKEAVVHWAQVTEPSKRWSILSDVEAPARAFKPKLKCTGGDPWTVVATGEPVASGADVQAWVDETVKQWAEKGLDVKTKEEKAFSLN